MCHYNIELVNTYCQNPGQSKVEFSNLECSGGYMGMVWGVVGGLSNLEWWGYFKTEDQTGQETQAG